MIAEIHSKDLGKKESEGQTLRMERVLVNTQIRIEEGLRLGEDRERLTLIVLGEELDGSVLRNLRLELTCWDIEKILTDAATAGMLPNPKRDHILKLLSELQVAIASV